MTKNNMLSFDIQDKNEVCAIWKEKRVNTQTSGKIIRVSLSFSTRCEKESPYKVEMEDFVLRKLGLLSIGEEAALIYGFQPKAEGKLTRLDKAGIIKSKGNSKVQVDTIRGDAGLWLALMLEKKHRDDGGGVVDISVPATLESRRGMKHTDLHCKGTLLPPPVLEITQKSVAE